MCLVESQYDIAPTIIVINLNGSFIVWPLVGKQLLDMSQSHQCTKKWSQCNKTFIQKGHLIKYQKFHTGKKDFKYDQCKKVHT